QSPHSRRTDAGGGRRGEGGNPRPHGRPCRQRSRDLDDLLGVTRGPRPVRPDRGDARRDGGRHARPGGRDAGTGPRAGPRAPNGGAGMSRYRRELSVLLAWLGLLAVLAIGAKSDGFFGTNQLRNMLVAVAPALVVAVGMTPVILARQIDISIGAQVSVCGVVFGLAVRDGRPLPVAALVAVGLGPLFGAVNGWLVAGLKLPSIVVTLATLVILREGLRYGREGEAVYGLPSSFQWFGFDSATGPWVIVGAAAVVF